MPLFLCRWDAPFTHTHTHTHMLSYCSLQGEKQLDPEGVREGGRETDGYGYLCD